MKPAMWIYLSPLAPLALLALTGLYMFVLPYRRRRAQWKKVTKKSAPSSEDASKLIDAKTGKLGNWRADVFNKRVRAAFHDADPDVVETVNGASRQIRRACRSGSMTASSAPARLTRTK